MVVVIELDNIKIKVNQDDHNPPHAHAEGGGASIRINLKSFEPLDEKTGFNRATVVRIIEIVKLRHGELLAKWEEFHGKED